MTSLSEPYKRRMLAPIETLLKGAIDEGTPSRPNSGGRNIEPPIFDEEDPTFESNHSYAPARSGHVGKVDKEAYEQTLYRMNGLIGLQSAKQSIRRLSDFACIESERRRLKLPRSEITFHCVFTGAPGTGKTSFARLLGKLLHSLGLLESGHTIEVSKSDLVGGYLGQTPLKVKKVFDHADGGVLFLDEAYSLTHDDQDLYGKEAIDMIVKLMEDRRDRVVVIVAGYPKQMREFIASNPGLRSRFSRTIFFDNFDAEELYSIEKQMIRSSGFDGSDGFFLRSELMWQKLYEQRLTHGSNARLVRSAMDIILENQAARLNRIPRKKRHELCELIADDLDGVETQLRWNHDD